MLAVVSSALFNKTLPPKTAAPRMTPQRISDIKIPGIFKLIMKWVTPVFLYGLLIWWTLDEAIPKLMMEDVEDPATIPYRWASRLLMLGLVAIGLLLIRKAWKSHGRV